MSSKLNRIKGELIQNMDKSLGLIKQINTLSKNFLPETIYSIYELSLLKIYLSWESFIGRSFILYMMGEKTDSGYAPRRYIFPKDEKHAYDLIKGERRFPDWLNVEFIREKSDLFFENGEPFKPALYMKINIKEALHIMRILRNAIVHASRESQEKYEELLRNEMGYVSNVTPGEFLLQKRTKKPKASYIIYYKKILEVVSNDIVR